MKSYNNLMSVFVGVILTLVTSSCAKTDKSESSPAGPVKVDLKPEALQSDKGCLSAEKLHLEFNQLDRSIQVLMVPTKLGFESKRGIRSNFEKIVAFNHLAIDQKPISQIFELENANQNGCDSINVIRSNGITEFSIKESSPNHLRFQAKDGETMAYQLLSERSLRITRKYVTYDLPCRTEKTPILVEITRVIDWSGNSIPETIGLHNSQFAIERPFLSLAAQAVGADENVFYVQSSEGEKLLSIGKLREAMQLEIRPEILSCNGGLGPQPDPSEPNPDDPENDGGAAEENP